MRISDWSSDVCSSDLFLNMFVTKNEQDGRIDLGDFGYVPTIARREVNTAVLVDDGQTVVIGGVYEFKDSNDVSKLPFLGYIPFLGNLFKRKIGRANV